MFQGDCKLAQRVAHLETGLVHDGPPRSKFAWSYMHASTRAFIKAYITGIIASGCYLSITGVQIGCLLQSMYEEYTYTARLFALRAAAKLKT